MRLGDAIEKFTTATGIKWLVKKIWGENCGCEKRRDALNEVEFKLTINKHEKTR